MTQLADIVHEAQALEPALALLAAGEPVAIPTETVYGLAADATNGEAVARIFAAKRRPRFNPLIAHVSGIEMGETHAVFDPLSRRLAEAFWPGPLTLVLPRRERSAVHPLVTAGLPTLAVRSPRGFARGLIEAFGRPLAAPSANSSGRVSATGALQVAADLGGRIRLVVDGGRTAVGVESTIVKVTDGRVELLRPGGITMEELAAATGVEPVRHAGAGIQAPGMMASHYAPRAAVRLNATALLPGEALLAFGSARPAGSPVACENLSPSGDLREAAANLFSMLDRLDGTGASTIAVSPIPAAGLGEAINDRLARAAAPRDVAGEVFDG